MLFYTHFRRKLNILFRFRGKFQLLGKMFAINLSIQGKFVTISMIKQNIRGNSYTTFVHASIWKACLMTKQAGSLLQSHKQFARSSHFPGLGLMLTNTVSTRRSVLQILQQFKKGSEVFFSVFLYFLSKASTYKSLPQFFNN